MNLTAEAVLNNGKYVLDTKLGQGVFGITYRATNTKSGQPVVIKTLAGSLRDSPNFERFRQRLQVGARLLASCKHPNLVLMLDYFEDDGCPYLVMDYIPGQTLDQLVQQGKPMPVPQALYYIRQIGAALGVLHSSGLLHRDVRPQNIIRRQGTHKVVLTDVGIACELTQGVMQTHASLISAGYAPIEKYLAQAKRTQATDVYALAATLYFLLTGRPPVPASVRDRIPLLDLRQFQPNLNPAIEQAILQGMEISASKRPQTVENWISLLPKESFLQSDRKRAVTRHSSKRKAKALVQHRAKVSVAVDKSDASAPSVKKSELFYPKFQKVLNFGRGILDLRLAKLLPAQTTTDVAKNEGNDKPKKQIQSGSKSKKLPLRSLMITGAVAASAGIGFGLALRLNRPIQPGSTIVHTEQSFPPRSNWPVSDPPELSTDDTSAPPKR